MNGDENNEEIQHKIEKMRRSKQAVPSLWKRNIEKKKVETDKEH